MKTGDQFYLDHDDLLRPMIGKVVTVEFRGEPGVTARITEVLDDTALLTVVPSSTKE